MEGKKVCFFYKKGENNYLKSRLFNDFFVYLTIVKPQNLYVMSNTKTAVKKETAKVEEVKNLNASKVEKSASKVDEIMNPTADARIKKLETFNRLAEKKQKIDRKLEELVNFNASNDGTQSEMIFSGHNGYRFAISNPVTIQKLLGFVEQELAELKETTEKEIVSFSI